jgi:autotransporter passenger strand-loop-strand repeat protein
MISGGSVTVAAGGVAVSASVNTGGGLYLYGGTASNTVINGGILQIQSGAITGTVTFTGSGGTININNTAAPAAVISGFAVGDGIALSSLYYNAADTVNVATAGVVTVSAGGATYSYNIAGATVGESDFQLSAAQYGYYGVLLTKTATSAAVIHAASISPANTGTARMNFIAPADTGSAGAAVPSLGDVSAASLFGNGAVPAAVISTSQPAAPMLLTSAGHGYSPVIAAWLHPH